MLVVKYPLIKFRKKPRSTCFFPKQTLDFILHRLIAGPAEIDTDGIVGLTDGSLEKGGSQPPLSEFFSVLNQRDQLLLSGFF